MTPNWPQDSADVLWTRTFSEPNEDDPLRDFYATYFARDDDTTRAQVMDFLDRIVARYTGAEAAQAAVQEYRAQIEALPGVPCHRWHEHTDANGGEAHAAAGSGAISRAAVLALLDTSAQPEGGER